MSQTLVVIALLALPLYAQEPLAPKAQSTVRASAEAVVSAKPDRARLSLGVVTHAASAQEAGRLNAAKTSAVLDQLHKSLDPAARIQTQGYSLSPQYRYPKEGGQPAIDGYIASNTVEITTDDLGALGKLIDAATQSGANNVQSLQFLLRDERALRIQAMREAAAQARAEAEAMAAALGLRPVRVLTVEEEEAQAPRPVMRAAALAAGAPTPIEAGTLEVRARVTLTLEVQ